MVLVFLLNIPFSFFFFIYRYIYIYIAYTAVYSVILLKIFGLPKKFYEIIIKIPVIF